MAKQSSLFDWARTRAPRPSNPQSGGLEALGAEAREIWRVLDRDCRGRTRATTAAIIALRAGIGGDGARRVRDLIALHMDDWPVPPVGLPGTPAGYYLPTTAEELTAGHRVIVSRQIELAARERALVRAGKGMGWEYQGKGVWR